MLLMVVYFLATNLLALPDPPQVDSHSVNHKQTNSKADLGATPMTALGVVPNAVVCAHPDPLRDGSVLLKTLGKRLLGAQGLVRRLR